MVLNETYQACLVRRIVDNDQVEALFALSSMIERIVDNDVEVCDYEITTSVGRNYKNPNCLQMQLKLAYEKRGKPCPAGTRVGYVVGKGEGNVAAKVIPAEFAEKSDVDRAWYLRDHLQSTFVELFGLFGDINTSYVNNLFLSAVNRLNAAQRSQKPISLFFKKAKRY